uniref:RING-type domain-containing protein n=1 Tax=Timema shepardi TaxID=629360 RepID=A0A7R9AT09_TIMSH|nr:unnamed protein product [Timema shepardi]
MSLSIQSSRLAPQCSRTMAGPTCICDCPYGLDDLAAIRKLLESEACTGTCPSCKMPFDKGKKRKLIDSCGHERCYSCMFRNEACPLCACAPDSLPPKKSVNSQDGLYGEVKGAGQHVRSKMKTNGHFTSYMQSRQESAGLSPEWCQSPNRLPKTRPPTSRSGSLARQDVMTQSCPTPPQNRRKFFLSPKSLRGAWGQRGDQVGPPRPPADIMDNPSALSDTLAHSLDTLAHSQTRWLTHWTRWPIPRHAGSLTGHAGPFPDSLTHSLDTLVHSQTRWPTSWTRWSIPRHASPLVGHSGLFPDTTVHSLHSPPV